MQITDSHVHFWNPEKTHYPWLANIPALNRAFLIEDFIAATRHLDIGGIIFVEADCAASEKMQEISDITQLASQHAFITGIVAGRCPENATQFPLVKSIRMILQDRPASDCLQPPFIAKLNELTARQFCFDLCIRAVQLPAIIKLVERCPETQFILNHLGKPAIRQHAWKAWGKNIRRLAQFPNIVCKISGLATEADPANWTVADLRPWILHAAEQFGENRILYGSDWPVVNLAGGYQRWLDAIQEIFSAENNTIKEKFFQLNTQTIYKTARIATHETT